MLVVRYLNILESKLQLNSERQTSPQLNIHLQKKLFHSSKVKKVCLVEKFRSDKAIASLFKLAAEAKLKYQIKE